MDDTLYYDPVGVGRTRIINTQWKSFREWVHHDDSYSWVDFRGLLLLIHVVARGLTPLLPRISEWNFLPLSDITVGLLVRQMDSHMSVVGSDAPNTSAELWSIYPTRPVSLQCQEWPLTLVRLPYRPPVSQWALATDQPGRVAPGCIQLSLFLLQPRFHLFFFSVVISIFVGWGLYTARQHTRHDTARRDVGASVSPCCRTWARNLVGF